MRSTFVTGISMFFMAMGFMSIVWVSTSLLGRAQSQPQPTTLPQLSKSPVTPRSTVEVGADSAPSTAKAQEPSEILTDEYAPSSLTTEGYVYDPTGRRDPFKPYTPPDAIKKETTTDGTVISSDPLQIYDLAQYKIVGILWDTKTPRAMVKDPTGRVFPLKKETRIGRNNGFVSMIREGAVLVVEPAFGDNGLQTAVTRVLLLSK
jgi:type IV pilus assembly protein PilP